MSTITQNCVPTGTTFVGIVGVERLCIYGEIEFFVSSRYGENNKDAYHRYHGYQRRVSLGFEE